MWPLIFPLPTPISTPSIRRPPAALGWRQGKTGVAGLRLEVVHQPSGFEMLDRTWRRGAPRQWYPLKALRHRWHLQTATSHK